MQNVANVFYRHASVMMSLGQCLPPGQGEKGRCFLSVTLFEWPSLWWRYRHCASWVQKRFYVTR